MPTQPAYAVPTGRLRIAYASPTMLATRPRTKTTVGASRVKPSVRPRAVAHTASRTPDRTRTSQDMTTPGLPSCRCPGTAPLVRGSAADPPPPSHVLAGRAGDHGH